MPSIPSNSSSSAALGSAIVRVEKATSEFLIGPDWTMNLEICDILNSNQWLAKDIVRSVKKRLLHKNPKVHLLSLTLLETMVKNCGDYVHFQIADRNVLQEMVKIVKKKVVLFFLSFCFIYPTSGHTCSLICRFLKRLIYLILY